MAKKPKRSAAQRRASRANGQTGGRPRKVRLLTGVRLDKVDELDALQEGYAALVAAMRSIVSDADMSDREKRQELRATVRAMGALVPKARLRRAELEVRGEATQIAATGKDAAVEPVPKDEA